MAAGADDMPALRDEARGGKHLRPTGRRPPMSSRDIGFVALGRFLVVERYRETCLVRSTSQPRDPGPDRTGGHADKLGSSSSRVPAGRRQVS
jgi:hypothetical protein